MTTSIFSLRSRLKAAGWHFLLSLLVAGFCAGLVFGLWFPPPYAVLAGGVGLFLLVTTVDIVMGPLLTLVAYDIDKTRDHLRRDIATIVVLQVLALFYGLNTVYEARPVVLAAENMLFRVVAANEVDTTELSQAPEGMQYLSLMGPKLLGVRPASNGAEKIASIQRALEGFDGGARPLFWEDYEKSKPRVRGQIKNLTHLVLEKPQAASRIESTLRRLDKSMDEVGYMDVKARAEGWIILISKVGCEPLEFLDLN